MERKEGLELIDAYWGPRARLSEKAHYLVATSYAFRNAAISVTIVVLSTVSGSAVFVTTANQNAGWQYVAATFSLVTATLAGLQRALDYGKKSSDHQKAGAAWNQIVTKTEQMRSSLATHPAPDAQFDKLRADIDTVTKDSPQIPERIFKREKIGTTFPYGTAPT